MAVTDDLKWFEDFKQTPRYGELKARPVAYFCAEFALRSDLPTYSGGLGILAGDVVREAADRGVPMVAIGLYYNKGYICKRRQDGSGFVEVCDQYSPEQQKLEAVLDASGNHLIIQVPLYDRQVFVQAWRVRVGDVSVYLLDTNLSNNSEADRAITDRLYIGEKETRLSQEVVLGVGGLRLLETLGVHPSIYHLNEGHSAFLILELLRHEMHERNLGFSEAKQFVRRRVVFTNHTLVQAGNEIYDDDLVALLLGPYCQNLGIPMSDFLALGRIHESTSFSMTMLSLRIAGISNGVSKLHAIKAKDVWSDHPMIGITNGIHVPTWDMLASQSIESSGSLWNAHQFRKHELLAMIAEQTGKSWGAEELLLGWARRITRYKRPLAIIEDVQRFAGLARQAGRPIRLMLAGQPHPSDQDGLAMLHEMQTALESQLGDVAVYIPEYDMEKAKLLVSGCDVWLNTPVVGFEASGTSGMKAALNGVLPCTTRDGWVPEVELFGVGWAVESENIGKQLLDVLEQQTIPMYYGRTSNGVPENWERHMHNARQMVLDRFTATRMLREYVELLYG